ncbi:MAG: transglutaminase domain-containing protein [Candidatus Dojkabacteria bacterium]
MRKLLTLFLTFSTLISYGQTATSNFSLIDERVKTIQGYSVESLSKKLTEPYKAELDKVRSIFKWITENIEYDVAGYNNPEALYAGLFRPTISTIDSVIQQDYNDRIIEKVLTDKKAICDGYARLFKTLCDYANIQSVMISGYIRWYSDPIGVVTERGHAWNAVFINNKWQLLDPTWASGSVNDSVTKFTKKYDNFYFLTDPVRLINDHYPSDTKWILFTKPPNRQLFYYYPFFHHDFYTSNIISYKPINGLIDVTIVNKKVRIELETNDKEKELYVMEYPHQTDTTNYDSTNDTLSIEKLNVKYTPTYRIVGKKIYCDYELQSEKTKRLDILYNDKLILSYRIRMYK